MTPAGAMRAGGSGLGRFGLVRTVPGWSVPFQIGWLWLVGLLARHDMYRASLIV